MKKWKEIPKNEKWMIILIVLLLIGVIIRWAAVKDGIWKSFNWLGSDRVENVDSASTAVPDSISTNSEQ